MPAVYRWLCLAILLGTLIVPRAGRAQPDAEASPTSAQSLGLTELTDDLSRQQLFGEIQAADRQGDQDAVARADEASQTFNLVGPFRFPGDTTYDSALNKPRVDSYFGVDISHYTSESFPIEWLKVRNVLFLYMKATQGSQGLDGKFAFFWKRTGDLPKGKQVHRGAYHFLSACQGADCTADPAKWGKLQADTFIKVLRANGGLLATDMPPVIDLEWDKASVAGPDRWQNRSAQDISAMVDAFIQEVQTQLKRTPMIYTAQSWWKERMKAAVMSPTMNSAPLWLADYSKSSRASEVPRTIGGAKWTMWQFTDSGTMATGFNGAFDANIYKGPLAAFYRSLGVQDFAP
jgi:lysozyme